MLTEVGFEEFFNKVGPLDVVTSPHEHHCEWRTRNRRLIGKSYPGYKEPGDPKKYELDLEWFKTNQKL